MPQFDGSPYTQLTNPARGDLQGVIKDISETQPENQTKYAALEDLVKYGSWASKLLSVTASGSVTLLDTDPMFVEIDPNGSNRDVNFPAKGNDNHGYFVHHVGSANTLTLKRSGGATITTLTAGDIKYIKPSTANDFSELFYLSRTGLSEWDEQGSDPGTPASTKWKLYFKSGGLYIKDDAGTVIGPLGSGGMTAQALTDGANIEWNAANGAYATITIAGNRTFNAPTNLTLGSHYVLVITQDGTGGRTPTFNSVFKNVPKINVTASGKTFLEFISDGTNLYFTGEVETLLPFGVYLQINPLSASPSNPYMAAVTRNLRFINYAITVFVDTTNSGSHYWTIALKTLAGTTIFTFNTSAYSASTWTVKDSNSFTTLAATASDKLVYLECTKTGSPGNLYLTAPVVSVILE